MAKSPLISGRAVGYWGRNPHARVVADKTVDKVTSWNLDKIMTMGLPFAVWREAASTVDNLPDCSCVKDTAKQADVPCLSCYGTGKVPGFLKFGTRTYWMSSIDPGWVTTNIALDKVNRPFRLHLVDDQLSGTAISPAVAIDLTGKLSAWDYKIDGFTRGDPLLSNFTVEYSVDGGTVWLAMSQLNITPPTTTIKFKLTITRTAVGVKSPMLEMIRLRFQTMADLRKELSEPVIRVLETWDKNAESRTTYGNRQDSAGKRFWTMPLAFFDPTMPRETPLSRLMDDVFIEIRFGGNIGFRFALIEFDYSDTFSEFTRQEFGLRQYSGQPGKMQGEFAYRVW